MIWIPITIGAAAFQVARNAAQRSVMGGAGPWGATLVRFLFGLPFATVFAAIAWFATPGAAAHPTPWVLLGCAAGGGLQSGAAGGGGSPHALVLASLRGRGGAADRRDGGAADRDAPVVLRLGNGPAAERPAVRPGLGRAAVWRQGLGRDLDRRADRHRRLGGP